MSTNKALCEYQLRAIYAMELDKLLREDILPGIAFAAR